MKERPILFNGEMVRAVLDHRKTQTRRVIKEIASGFKFKMMGQDLEGRDLFEFERWLEANQKMQNVELKCPYGDPGDRLWVRETFALECNNGFQDVYRKPDNPLGPVMPCKDPEDGEYFLCPRYKASEPETILGDDEEGMRWKPSIHMPRWASRINLEVTVVRVERVQEISEADSRCEGGPDILGLKGIGGHSSYKEWFHALWDSINEKRGFGWEKNRLVWVVKFKRI